MKTLLFLFLINLAVAACFGQGASVNANANSCELNSLHLDGLRNELASDPTAKIVARSYVGKSENNVVGQKRSDYIRKFLEKNKGFDPARLEFVESGKLETKEDPKTEFYIVRAGSTEHQPYLITHSRPNRTPCLDCCGDGFSPKNIASRSTPKQKRTKK